MAAPAALPVPTTLTAPRATAPTSPDEARTRDRVRLGVLEHGPVAASDLAVRLGLTPAAVRKHLDALLDAGQITEGRAPHAPRGRGRPARHFVLTSAGHAAGATGYGDLAVAVLRYLEESGGPAAVRAFAQARTAEWEDRYRAAVDAAGDDPGDRVEALARALSADGYAASTRPLDVGDPAVEGGMTTLGTQLCQGHCPVQRVAAEYPQLCEAEAEAFGRLLGVHVQRLATLAHGEHVCTTHVPNGPVSVAPGLHDQHSHDQNAHDQNANDESQDTHQERTAR